MLSKILLCIGAILVFFVIFGGVLTPFMTPFYYKCKEIKVGMSQERVYEIMSQYLQNEKYMISTDGGLFLYTESFFDDYQCNIDIEGGIVTDIQMIFD